LKADLESKYTVIFHNYGLDLETVQKIYDTQKHSPPMVRNAAPVSGNIIWARQLLRRIEEPMKKFKQNKNIMTTKESKKIIRTYNKVARALIEFETLWHHAWCKSIEAAKSGLQATLIVRHPRTGKLFVNFDREILQLVRETKCLQRIGIEVPESAKMVLLQEDKFKSYYNQLTFVLKEYDRVLQRIIPVIKPLLKPHLEDLNGKLQPGMLVLTWQSMNIDGYLHRIHLGLQKLDELVSKVNDIIENRIESNIKLISKTSFVDLPDNETFTLEQFVGLQEKVTKRKTKFIEAKNVEVERAVSDLITSVQNTTLDVAVQVDDQAVRLRDHYSRVMYLAILQATKYSLFLLKSRLTSRVSGGFIMLDRPFFDVNVELNAPNVTMNPPLEEIQSAINRCAIHVLRVSKRVYQWGGGKDKAQSFNQLIAKDKEIVKVVLFLTGSVEGTKKQVNDYLGEFFKYDFLWLKDKVQSYKVFCDSKPDLEQFDLELKKYMQIEREIGDISLFQNIGCMNLDTSPIKATLRAEANAWKNQYARNLHASAQAELTTLVDFMKDTISKIERPLVDLDDVRDVMNVLKATREKESDIDFEINPIEEKYQLLARYDVRVPKEDVELVQDLRVIWKKVHKAGGDVSTKLSGLQTGFKKELLVAVKLFIADAQTFRQDFEENGPLIPGLSPMDAAERLKKYQRLFQDRERKWTSYSEGETLFGLQVTQYPELMKTKKELELLDKMYSLYVNVVQQTATYADTLWTDVIPNMDAMAEQFGSFKQLCSKLPKALKEWNAYKELNTKIESMIELIPLLQQLANKAMRSRHWQSLMELTGVTITMDAESLKLSQLLEMNFLKFADDVEEICTAAVKELQIETKLGAISADWADQAFQFNNFKTKGPVILKGAAEINEKLEESQMALGSMATNRYSGPFREDVLLWIQKLSTVAETIEQWTVVQSMWIYMEAVFSSGDIAKQLPQEAKRFASIDKVYMKIMAKSFETPNVINCCYGNELMKTSLPWCTEQLELCQKSLTGYLETKRGLFPRFYFVSDGLLLEILSQGSDPQAIQQHLSQVFDSINSTTFDKVKKNLMINMMSPDPEVVQFSNPVEATGNIEDYLTKLVKEMQNTLRDIVRDGSTDSDSMKLDDFIEKYCAQVCLLGLQLNWTKDVTDALAKAKSDKSIMNVTSKKINGILADLISGTAKDMTKLRRTNIETLITIQVHQKDIMDSLVRLKIKDSTDFEWQKQARFYYRTDVDLAIISVTDVDFEYCYEYLGCKERLCITPLTDRCYITLSQACGMFLGGFPAGPAGTGKTETVKDLGRGLGKFVVVFNCSDQMDFRALGKLYKGIAMSGVWGCMDEFNRIDLEVLSVAAQQVHCVFTAMRERKPTFAFTDGQVVPVDMKCGIFITGNPGYAGRQELPENLKVLFRGVCMMVPDREIIMRVKLASVGYQENGVLSKKFNVLYALCEQQLSKQRHYDFGLRNILSVLRTAGATKRSTPEVPEEVLLMRTLRDMNLSKFVADDVPLFISLIGDMFPGINPPKAEFPDMERETLAVIKEAGLQPHKDWVSKIVQLYETYIVRHGLCVIGPSGAGKTCVIETLAKALTNMGTKHKIERMNPKSITAPQMFGRLDVVSNDWTDGIFAVLWRKSNKTRTQNTWICLDGPVDAIWIENLNTVLDDNKLLTLANGDRISMIPNVKLVMEPENLDNASPATVSRMGIIYVSDSSLGWQPLVQSWIQVRRVSEQAILKSLLDKMLEPLIEFVYTSLKHVIGVMKCSVIASILKIIDCFLRPWKETKEVIPDDRMERMVVYGVMWGMGGLLELDERKKLDQHLRAISSQIPGSGTTEVCFDFRLDDKGMWLNWSTAVVPWEYPQAKAEIKFAEILLPTTDSVRYQFLMNLLVPKGNPVLIVGASGVTKSSTVNQFLITLDPEKHLQKSVPFSFETGMNLLQRIVESAVEKRQGRTYGPPGGRGCVIFFDDMSMPKINEWRDQPTNEVTRQVLSEAGIYSLDKPGEWKIFADLYFVGAMTHPGGGRNDIPNRLKRQFCVVNVTMPNLTAIDNIFGTIIRGRFPVKVFDDGIVKIAGKLTEATIALWQKVVGKLFPTPAKFHYMFNMRELSRVFSGICACPRNCVKNDVYLLKLWKHECERVFGDKLISLDDKKWLGTAIADVATENLGGRAAAKNIEEAALFVNFMKDPIIGEEGDVIDDRPKSYEMAKDIGAIRAKSEEFMQRYNDEHKVGKLELVLFDYALEHMCRISRIITQDRSSALLVGVGGSGKQSLCRLASFIAGNFIFQITITKHYNVGNLFDDLKSVHRVAGVQAKHVTFMLSDAEVKDETFLEYFNQLLSTGEVQNLFPKDELDGAAADCRNRAKKEIPGFIDTNDNLVAYFMSNVRNNIHICMCFSPVGDKLSSRARKFPGLINCCTIDWFLQWPAEGLKNVSERFIGAFTMETNETTKQALMTHMGNVHKITQDACQEYFEKFRRYVYVTPKSYLSFIKNYKTVYSKEHSGVKVLADKVNNGLLKLGQAEKDVAKMKIELAEKEIILADAQKKSAALLQEITVSTARAEKTKKEVQVVKDSAFATATKIGKEKADVEEDLKLAKPALIEAEDALKAITAKDIQGLKALKSPPDVIKVVFDGVLILKRRANLGKWQETEIKGIKVCLSTYTESTKMMSEMTFLQSLLEFPKENITDEDCELLQPYVDNELFTVDKARTASGMAAGLCAWARAMHTYHRIAKFVTPKIDALRVKEGELAVANKKLAVAQAELDKAQGELDAMQRTFDAAMAEKQRLQDETDLTKRRMDAATALITGLSGEKTRWTQQSNDFSDQIARLVGDCGLACAFMSYCGAFNKTFRDLLMGDYFLKDMMSKGIPVTKGLNVTKMLTTESETGEWNIQGLPTDELSTQNGILVTRASRWPLMCDPQGQGRSWIKKKEEANNLVVTNFNEKTFRFSLEDCMSLGKPLLIENVEEEIDPLLDPILDKAFVKKGKNFTITLSDKEIDYSENFKLFITTRLANPHFTPELSAKVTVIDFTVTLLGLEDQLLGRVVAQEKPELQEQRKKLLEEVNSYQKRIKELEDDLLYRLSSSTGNLLDDTTLIEVLAITKKTSREVNEKLKSANEAELRIISACEEYRPVAIRGSVMYFLIAEMSAVNPMYQTSLTQFIGLFENSMTEAEKAHIPAKRIHNIIELLTYSVFLYICRGFFEAHKEIFAALLAMKIQLRSEKIGSEHFNAFVKGGDALDINTVKKKPKEWILDSAWLNIIQLSNTIPLFKELPDSIARNDAAWKQWYDHETPETCPIPDFDDRADALHKMLVVRSFRTDRTLLSTKMYVAESLGQRFVETVPLNWEATWQESSWKIPLVCLLSPGADPSESILNLAKKKKKEVKTVSMGQGQEIIARRLISSGIATGNWILLQNTHLGLKFLLELELQILSLEEVHPEFRVWITSEPHPKFPIGLLQMSIKITNEAPVGLKAGLKRTYAWVNQDMLDAIPRPEWRTVLYTMCYMHSILQERRKFGAIGWAIAYEYNQSDLSASVQFIQNHMLDMEVRKVKEITWTTVRYMVSEIQYGGRVSDDWDRRLLNTFSDKYFVQNMFDPSYALFPNYTIPQGTDIAVFRSHVEQIPIFDNPELFGIHANGDLVYRLKGTSEAFETILETQPKSGGGSGGMTREETVDKLAEELLSKVPKNFDIANLRAIFTKLQGGITNPINIAFRQEIDRLQAVISITRSTLQDLQLAIAGTIILSSNLIDAMNALYDARVPKLWTEVSWTAPTLGVWFPSLVARYEQWDRWLKQGRPKVFWLTGFFNPQGFITAMRQEISRKHQGWALDDVVVYNTVTKMEAEDVKDHPPEGIYIQGLYLDGCAWSKKENKLVDSAPKQLFAPLPVLHLNGVLKTNDKYDYATYVCPLYISKKRTDQLLVLPLKLRIEDKPSKWIIRGVCLLCSKD